jgi:predicted transcriptional regulator
MLYIWVIIEQKTFFMPDLIIIDQQQLQYENQALHITVLGGIRLEGLDRLRVTLKIQVQESPRPPFRNSIDLYNDTQLEKFIRKAAEKLEIGTTIIAASISELTEQLENYRLEQLKQSTESSRTKVRELSEAEKKEATTFLQQENLLSITNDLIGQSGLIGEANNRIILFLIYTYRKAQTPLHVICLASSGTGKTHLQERVSELIPEEDKIEITTLSENAFYYFGQRELKNKLILIEDLDGAENVLYPLRELMSKKRISKTIAIKSKTGETKTIHLIVEGPVAVSGCTTRESIYEDNANRSFLLYLDESITQDDAIMDYQRKLRAGKIDTAAENNIKALLKNCQRLLQPIRVVNPYAELLTIPTAVLKPRRSNEHYLLFIEAIAFYKQYQRVILSDSEGTPFIEVQIEDIEEANHLLKDILLRKSDELSGSCRDYLQSIEKYITENQQTKFTNREIRKQLKLEPTKQKRFTKTLLESYYIKRVQGSKAKGFEYAIVSPEEYKQLQNNIDNVLQDNVNKVRATIAQKEPKRKRA